MANIRALKLKNNKTFKRVEGVFDKTLNESVAKYFIYVFTQKILCLHVRRIK